MVMKECIGDEPGCKNGEIWLKDPRCHPYCRGTVMKKTYNNVSNYFFITIVAILILALVVIIALRMSSGNMISEE